MQWVLNEDQVMIRDAARGFAGRHSSVERVRKLRDAADDVGFSRDVWKACVQQGFTSIPFPEDQGGAGLGLRELALILEALGAGLAPEPFLSSVLLAGSVLSGSDNAACREAHLPAIIGGERLAALAWAEPGRRFARDAESTRLEDGQLHGEKVGVLDGHGADLFIVSAHTPEGTQLYALPADAEGVSVVRQSRIDSRNAAILRLDNVAVTSDARLGDGALLETALDRATVGLCAEMLGAMSAAFEMTLEYLKTRKQFGAPIGSFQSLQHRAARLFIDIELSRAAVDAAAAAADSGDAAALASAASLAKVRCGETLMAVAYEGVQMHGGIGMTDEHAIGFYLKRARVAEMEFGDAAWHRDRWARQMGF